MLVLKFQQIDQIHNRRAWFKMMVLGDLSVRVGTDVRQNFWQYKSEKIRWPLLIDREGLKRYMSNTLINASFGKDQHQDTRSI